MREAKNTSKHLQMRQERGEGVSKFSSIIGSFK